MRETRHIVRAGRYRHVVRIEKLTDTTDDLGGHPKEISVVFRGHAQINPAYAFEREHNMQTKHEVTHVIRMRSLPEFDPATHRLIKEFPTPERIFAVYSKIDIEERGRLTQMLCIEQPGKF